MRAGFFRSKALESVNDECDRQENDPARYPINRARYMTQERASFVRAAARLIRTIEEIDKENS